MNNQEEKMLNKLRQIYGVPDENLEKKLQRQPDSHMWLIESPGAPVHFDIQTGEFRTPSGERLDDHDWDCGAGTLFLTPLPLAAVALVLLGKDTFFYQDTSKVPSSAVAKREIIVVGEDSDHVVPSLYKNGANLVWSAAESDLPRVIDHGTRAGLGLPCLKPLVDFRLLGAGWFGERKGKLCRLKFTESKEGTKEEEAIPITNGVPRPAEFIGDEYTAVFEVTFEAPRGARTRPVTLTPDLQSNPRQFREKFAGQRMGARILQLDRERRLPEVIVEACVEQWPDVEPAEENETLGFDENLGGYVFEQGFVSENGDFFPDTGGGIQVDDRRMSLTDRGPNFQLPQISTSKGPSREEYLHVLERTYGKDKSQLLFSWALSLVANVLPWWRDRETMLLNLVGPLSNGKTVCAQALAALFRCSPRVKKIDQLTVRATQEILEFNADVPVIFDDFRGSKSNHQEILSVLRSAYDNGETDKGTPVKGVTLTFTARGAPLITGEYLPHDETGALRSRCLVVAIDKSDREEDTLDELNQLYKSASSLLPKLVNDVSKNSERLKEVLENKRDFFRAKAIEAELKSSAADRMRELYAGLAAVREIVLGANDKVDNFFAAHLESSLTGVEDQSLVHEFLVGLNSCLTNGKRSTATAVLTSVNDGKELAVAKTAAVDLFKQHRRGIEESTSVKSDDITRHLGQYEDTWVADRSRTAKFDGRPEYAFVFNLEHADTPAPVLSLASHVIQGSRRKKLVERHEKKTLDKNSEK